VFIFLFLILLILRAISQGIKAKDKIISKKKKYFLDEEIKLNIVDEVKRLKKLREDKTLSKVEFKKAKNKLLND